jgi:tetratricopeptide (TPR) repeat protein
LADQAAATRTIDTLKTFHQKLVDVNDPYTANQVAIQIKAVEAWGELTFGDDSQAINLMKEAAEMESKTGKHAVTPCEVLPAMELLGDLYMEFKDYKSALAAYQLNVKDHPFRFNGLYGAAMAAKKSGNQALSESYFKQLLDLSRSVKSDRKEIATARSHIN